MEIKESVFFTFVRKFSAHSAKSIGQSISIQVLSLVNFNFKFCLSFFTAGEHPFLMLRHQVFFHLLLLKIEMKISDCV